ncbi:MAG: hypothetical protein MMC33_005816 [Icmadophila ericetorum]|nr:hypothetical protein [Icmadophila ericetorum]
MTRSKQSLTQSASVYFIPKNSSTMPEFGHSELISFTLIGARNRNARPSTVYLPPPKIVNPLFSETKEKVIDEAQDFYTRYGLSQVVEFDVFKRAVLVARDPDSYEDVEGLTDVEKRALAGEYNQDIGGLAQMKLFTRDFIILLATCCMAATVQGWDQSSINGANLGWPTEFGLNVNLTCKDDAITSDIWIFSFVNASTYLTAALLGCWLSDPLNEHVYGRKGALFVAGIFSFASVIGAAYTTNWRLLLACRILLGLGMGAKVSVVAVYMSEAAPTIIRGRVVVLWQTFVAFDLYYIHVQLQGETKYLTGSTDTEMSGCAAPSETHPEGKDVCAEDTHDNQSVHMNSKRNHKMSPGTYQYEVQLTSFWQRFGQLFRVPRIRRAALASFAVMLGQQLCGVNVLAFLSSTIFSEAVGSTCTKPGPTPDQIAQANLSALGMSCGFGLANFLFTWPAWLMIDEKGRRYLLNLSFPNMMWTLLAAGLCFLIPTDDGSTRIGLIVFFVLLFTLAYSAGEGPVAFTLSAEVFPLLNREVGMSFAVFWNLLFAGILSLAVPWLNFRLGSTGLLALFAGLNIPAWILVYIFVPETARRDLEELNEIFEVPTMDHLKYHIKVTQWWLKYSLLTLNPDQAMRPPPPYASA